MLLIDKHPEHADLIKFGDHCLWAWDCFQMAKAYCNAEDIHDWCGIDSILVTILREYSLLQIAKIHDPAQTSVFSNHSLDHFALRYGAEAEPALIAFKTENAPFIESVREARRKAIAHSDFEALRSARRLGAFAVGADDGYFRSLHKVVSRLYELAGIGPFVEWPHFIQDDANEFLKIAREVQLSRQRRR